LIRRSKLVELWTHEVPKVVEDITMHGAVARLVAVERNTELVERRGQRERRCLSDEFYLHTCMLGIPPVQLCANYTGMDASMSTPEPGKDLNDLWI